MSDKNNAEELINLYNDGKISGTQLLEDLYPSLYNSLGVEPGLLSRTSIGRKLNDKYRNDEEDVILTAYKYLPKEQTKEPHMNNISNIKVEDKTSILSKYMSMPVDISDNKDINIDIIEAIQNNDKSIAQIMKLLQIRDNLTHNDMLNEIRTFFTLYMNYYCIISKSELEEYKSNIKKLKEIQNILAK